MPLIVVNTSKHEGVMKAHLSMIPGWLRMRGTARSGSREEGEGNKG